MIVTAVASLGSPAASDSAIAVPAPAVSVSAPADRAAAASADLQLAAERATRTEQGSRSTERTKVVAAKQAAKRAKALGTQKQSIAAQQEKIAAAKAKAKAAAAAAAAAKARALANRGYEPGVTDPREMARQILKNKYNYGDDQYSCFNYIIMRESMWRVNATNRSSGAYGIPQALPGSKMATIASDWRTNPATQIIWGIEYMKKRYGSPCAAKGFKASHGWY